MPIQICTNSIPQNAIDNLCRELGQAVIKYFENPEVKTDFEKWLVLYRKRKRAT